MWPGGSTQDRLPKLISRRCSGGERDFGRSSETAPSEKPAKTSVGADGVQQPFPCAPNVEPARVGTLLGSRKSGTDISPPSLGPQTSNPM